MQQRTLDHWDKREPQMPKIQVDIEHDQVTVRCRHRYLFTEKHHGGPHSAGQAQWLPSRAFEAEFWGFDRADHFDFSDDDGRLYGLLKLPDTVCEFIGINDEQIATFPRANAGGPWHGYPVYPLAGVKRRSGDTGSPKNAIFAKMMEVGLLTPQQVTRLKKRKHI